MTRQEFLNYASKQPLFDVYHKLYFESDLTNKISQNYRSGSNPQKIIDFFMDIGDVEFERIEEVSKDILRIALLYSAGSNYYWNDVDCAVQYVGTTSNCAGTIEVLYISEQGKFYNQNHKLIAENEEVFLIILQRLSTTSTPKYQIEHITFCVISVGMRADISTHSSLNKK